MWHGVRARRMITNKGVRAGINPAPTPPLQTTFKIGDNSPQFSVKGDNVWAGIIPAHTNPRCSDDGIRPYTKTGCVPPPFCSGCSPSRYTRLVPKAE